MNNFHDSTRPSGSFDPNSGLAGLPKIYSVLSTCVFLDSLNTNANVLGGTAVATPELYFSTLAMQHGPLSGNQQGPWNSSQVSTARDKECRPQWQLLSWLIRKTDNYHQELQRCSGQDVPADLLSWLAKYPQPSDIRKVGLRTLGDIFQKSRDANFDEILCAAIVLRATVDKSNPFGGVVEAAFAGWGSLASLTLTNREALDVAFKRLAKLDSPLSGAAQPDWSRDLSGSPVLGTGTGFTNPPCYPSFVNDDSLSDNPTYEASNYNMAGNDMWLSTSGLGCISGVAGYPAPRPQSQPHPPSPYDAYGSGDYVAHPTMNTNLQFMNTMESYSHQPDPGQMYRSSQSYLPEAQFDMADLDRSSPFIVFMTFLDGFMELGDLLTLFSHTGSTSFQWSNLPRTHNARAAENEFFMMAERSLFGPLEESQPKRDPLTRAMISSTRSLASLGGLPSMTSMVDYMIHLGRNLLPNVEAFRNFARDVLKTCPRDSRPDRLKRHLGHSGSNEVPERYIDEIAADFCGAYYPAHLFHTQASESRSNRAHQPTLLTIPSQASRSQQVPSIINSSESNGQSHLDSSTDASTVCESFANSPAPSGYGVPHVPGTIYCECGSGFKGKHAHTHLSRHKRRHKETDKYIKCPYCNKIFAPLRTDNITTHCKNIHHKPPPGKGREYWASLVLSKSPSVP
ncbi:hypothetical protein GGR54DRAFT_324152 [Hypoxylon sp. NC1633]|nr:hypothetical protein GGR54DRAFT_324152 [Hypoxylon sp. NC1633]